MTWLRPLLACLFAAFVGALTAAEPRGTGPSFESTLVEHPRAAPEVVEVLTLDEDADEEPAATAKPAAETPAAAAPPATPPVDAAAKPSETATPAAPVVDPRLIEAELEYAESELWLDEQSPFVRGFVTAPKYFWNNVTTWTKRIAVGGRYVVGNSNEESINLTSEFERTAKANFTQFQLGGQYGRSNGVLGSNRWFANSTIDFTDRDEDRGWITFMKHSDEYDQLQNLDYRGTTSAGLGYKFANKADKRLIFRVGPAGTYENFTEPDSSRLTFDMLGEMESRFPLTKRMAFEHKTTFNPQVEDWSLYRTTTTANVTISLDEPKLWNLQLGVQSQYISEPNKGRLPHDFWTTMSIVYQRK